METFRTLAGWLLFLIMAVVAGFFWHQSAQRGAHIALLSDTMTQMESQINQLSSNIDTLEQQITDATTTIAAMKNELEVTSPKDNRQGTEEQPTAESLDISLGAIMDSFLQENASGDKDNHPLGGMMEVFQTPRGEQMLKSGVKMTVNMQFGDFFDMIAPEYVDAVREIVSDFMIHTARLGVGFMNADGDRDMEAAMEEVETARETLLRDLDAVIGEEGVALFEQYERELPGRLMDQSLEMQLGMFARGLSEETRVLVRQTLVEELLAVQPEQMPQVPVAMGGMQEIQENQNEAYARALDRLAVQLPEEDFNTVQQFVEQQQQMVNMFSSMMLPDSEKE